MNWKAVISDSRSFSLYRSLVVTTQRDLTLNTERLAPGSMVEYWRLWCGAGKCFSKRPISCYLIIYYFLLWFFSFVSPHLSANADRVPWAIVSWVRVQHSLRTQWTREKQSDEIWNNARAPQQCVQTKMKNDLPRLSFSAQRNACCFFFGQFCCLCRTMTAACSTCCHRISRTSVCVEHQLQISEENTIFDYFVEHSSGGLRFESVSFNRSRLLNSRLEPNRRRKKSGWMQKVSQTKQDNQPPAATFH